MNKKQFTTQISGFIDRMVNGGGSPFDLKEFAWDLTAKCMEAAVAEATKEAHKFVDECTEENAALIHTIRRIDQILVLEDRVWDVRDKERKGWDDALVVEYAGLVEKLHEIIGEPNAEEPEEDVPDAVYEPLPPFLRYRARNRDGKIVCHSATRQDLWNLIRDYHVEGGYKDDSLASVLKDCQTVEDAETDQRADGHEFFVAQAHYDMRDLDLVQTTYKKIVGI